ncbi:23454_t:CDS:2, partial [Dentiscutata erythropus]
GFFTALVLCACVTSISELDVEELLESLSEVSKLEEASVEYLTLSFNLLDARPGLDSVDLDKLFLVKLALLKSSLNNGMLIPFITILAWWTWVLEECPKLIFALHIHNQSCPNTKSNNGFL